MPYFEVNVVPPLKQLLKSFRLNSSDTFYLGFPKKNCFQALNLTPPQYCSSDKGL